MKIIFCKMDLLEEINVLNISISEEDKKRLVDHLIKRINYSTNESYKNGINKATKYHADLIKELMR